jgi:adenylate cyclase
MVQVAAAPREHAATPTPLPDKPSIAVLPFTNMSGDPEQEYFVDGMVEDIITGLSRIKWLFVIARNSSFIYKGKAVDVRQVGRDLGVRYVLEGGVRKAGNRVRITAQLLEAETGAHLWADRYDGALEDVFELQDQITDKVIGVVEPSLQKSEIERSRRKHPESLDAYDLYLRAVPYFASRKLADARIAADLLRKALDLDPNYAAAHALLAHCLQILYFQGGSAEADKAAGLRHARAAIASEVDDAGALAIAALVLGHLGGDHDSAVRSITRAVSINPSSATAHYAAAHVYIYSRNYDTAIAHAARALRLSPFDSLAFEAHFAYGLVAVHRTHYDEAASHFLKAAQTNAGTAIANFSYVAALALAGRVEEGRAFAKEHLDRTPGSWARLFADTGIEPDIAAKFTLAAKALEHAD